MPGFLRETRALRAGVCHNVRMAMASEGFTGIGPTGIRPTEDGTHARIRTRIIYGTIAVTAAIVVLLGVASIGYAPLLGAEITELISEY